MSLHLSPLYHWSPKRNREAILRDGLKLMNGSRGEGARFPWVCLATTPSSAWGLIIEPDEEEAGWDLWQVSVAEGDDLSIRGDFAPYVREVRVHNGLPSDRVWWVGERQKWPHDSLVGGDDSDARALHP